MTSKTLITAAWLAPMTGPIIRDGGVVFDRGRIVAVGPGFLLRDEHPDARFLDAGNACVMPGLVNAHTHLELSSITRPDPPARFVDWIIGLLGQTGALNVAESSRSGIAQCIRFGVTSVGDITSQPQLSRAELAQGPLRTVSFGEVRAMAQRRGFLEPRIAAAIGHPQSGSGAEHPGSGSDLVANIVNGISPHAPYSIEIDGYRRCLSIARQLSMPIATHLAETPAESEFLSDHTGPFRELWNLLGGWDSLVPRFSGGPIRFAQSIGLLDYPTLLAHVNYCDDAEMDLLIKGNASVVYCPRTHAYFGHPPHRWRDMLSRGINVAVGTDSCASSPDLNLLEELRWLHEIAPEVDPRDLWQMATINAARAIGLQGVGSLLVGNHADFALFAVDTADPLREIIQHRRLPSAVWIGGNLIQAHTQSAGTAC